MPARAGTRADPEPRRAAPRRAARGDDGGAPELAERQSDTPKMVPGFKIEFHPPPERFSLKFEVECEPTMEDFEANVLPVAKSVLLDFDNETAKITHAQKRLVDALAKTENGRKIFETVGSLVSEFCASFVALLVRQDKIEDVSDVWELGRRKQLMFSHVFQVLCGQWQPLGQMFSQELEKEFVKCGEGYKKLCRLFCDAYNALKDEEDGVGSLESVAMLFKEGTLYSTEFVPFFVESVIETLKPTVGPLYDEELHVYLVKIEEITAREDEMCERLFDCVSQLNDAIFGLVFTSKFESICNDGLMGLVTSKDADSIALCARLARATNSIETFTKKLASIFSKEAAKCFKSDDTIEKLLELHQELALFCDRAFGPQTSRTIRKEFENGFNREPETVAKLLAVEINKEFSNKLKDKAQIDEYAALARLLSLSDVFETYYTQLLTRRVLSMNDSMVEPETYFAGKLRDQCGEEYTRRIDALLADRAKSVALLSEYRESEDAPDFFAFLAVANEFWPTLAPLTMSIPKQIKKVLSDFEVFFKSRVEGWSLDWSLQLSTVKLTLKKVPGISTVKCSGDYAAILLHFNSHKQASMKELIKALHSTEDELEPRLTILTSRKGKKLLTCGKNGSYSINPQASSHSGKLALPLVFRKLSFADETRVRNTVAQNHDRQLDAAIIHILKPEKAMDRTDLMHAVAKHVSFRLDEEMFDARLDKLQTQDYVKIESSGRVHFIP